MHGARVTGARSAPGPHSACLPLISPRNTAAARLIGTAESPPLPTARSPTEACPPASTSNCLRSPEHGGRKSFKLKTVGVKPTSKDRKTRVPAERSVKWTAPRDPLPGSRRKGQRPHPHQMSDKVGGARTMRLLLEKKCNDLSRSSHLRHPRKLQKTFLKQE